MNVELFKPAKAQTFTAQAKQQILDLIRSGRLGPGDKLPAERELSSRLGISRTCTREAIQSLAATGVIEIQPGRGAFVRTGNPDALIARTIEENGLNQERLLELNELRRAIEVEAAGLAAVRATESDLKEMRSLLEQIQQRLEQGENAVQPDLSLHLAIAKATKNQLIVRVMKSLTSLMHRSFQQTQRVEDPKYILEGHREIFAQIEAKDPDGARRVMRMHMDRSRALLEKMG